MDGKIIEDFGPRDPTPAEQAWLNARQEAEPLPVPVPSAVTGAQLRIALHRRGLLPTVQAMVEAAVAATGDIEINLRWNAAMMERASPLLNAMAAQSPLSLSPQDIDDIFRDAATI